MPDLNRILDQIDRLDKQATQAPWKSHFGGNPHDEWLSVEPEKGSRTICTVTDDHHPNAEFIALARTVLPALSKALRAVIADCGETIEDADEYSMADMHLMGQGAQAVATLKVIAKALGADHE